MLKTDSDIVLCLVRLKFADCGVFEEDVVCIDRTDADPLPLNDAMESFSTIPDELEYVEAKLSGRCIC